MSLSAGNATYSGVHLTYLISEIVKMTTKVSLHPLKLLHDGLRVSPLAAEEEGTVENGRAEAVGSIISTRGCFDRS